MIQKRMRVSMAVTLAMLFVMLAFGRGRLAWFYDDVGTAAAEFAAALRPVHLAEDAQHSGGEEVRSSAPSVPATNPPQASSALRPTESPTVPEAEPAPQVPAEEPPASPDPQAVRDSAAAEIDALDPLHDELIEVLEAIHEALTDREEKRQARNQVAMARFTKRHDRSRLEPYAAGEEEWRVRRARYGAATVRASLERKIQEARANLARVRQSP